VWSVRLAEPDHGVPGDACVSMQGMAPVLATTPQALLVPKR